MKKTSFSQTTKQFLAGLECKKKCCTALLAEVAGMPEDGGGDAFRAIVGKRRCPNCTGVLIRALFLRFGSVTSPDKQYHLEFSFRDEALADAVEIFLDEEGIPPKRVVRKGRYIAYYKESSQIEDVLALIGATGAAFDVMNGKIMKEMRSSINRQVNCDTHNISATLEAGAQQCRAIRLLENNNKLSLLPPECRETARLRLLYPEDPMKELGEKHDPPISKSGVNHRMQKITEAAAELEAELQKQ